jgi:hypothetical protein
LLGTGQRRKSGVGAENETVTETETVTVIESETETGAETTNGDTDPAPGRIPGPERGIKGSLDIGPGAGVRVPSKTGRTGTSMEKGTWTDGGISMWTALPLKSLPLGTFIMAKLPASCSLDALCSWRD